MVKLNANEVMPEMARILERLSDQPAEKLLADHHLLDECIETYRKKFPWDELATTLNVSKQQIYRWYFDNYQRHLHGGIEKADMEIIKREVSIAVKNCTKITKEMQMIIKAKLSRSYHRNSFTIAFNNAKNTLSKLFGQQQRRPARSIGVDRDAECVEFSTVNLSQSRVSASEAWPPAAAQRLRSETLPAPPSLPIPQIPKFETISNTDGGNDDDVFFDFEWSV